MTEDGARPPGLGTGDGDADLVACVEPLLRSAGVLDRVSVVRIDGAELVHAHFGAGPDTVYEIGSLTKTMTAMLFVDAVDAGEVRPQTAVGSLLDLGDTQAAGATLAELASHRSGLPRIAAGLRHRVAVLTAVLRHRNPYTAATPDLLAHARAAKIAHRGRFSYSNLGAALLGEALGSSAGMSYPELLRRRLFQPLGMTQSTAPLVPDDLPWGAPTGWNRDGSREQPWTLNAYAPAGGVRSTVNDLARYVRAILDGSAPGLDALTPRWPDDDGGHVGYAWFTHEVGGTDVTWHNGRTGGFASMLAIDRGHRAAVVVLANTAVALDEIAIRVLLRLT